MRTPRTRGLSTRNRSTRNRRIRRLGLRAEVAPQCGPRNMSLFHRTVTRETGCLMMRFRLALIHPLLAGRSVSDPARIQTRLLGSRPVRRAPRPHTVPRTSSAAAIDPAKGQGHPRLLSCWRGPRSLLLFHREVTRETPRCVAQRAAPKRNCAMSRGPGAHIPCGQVGVKRSTLRFRSTWTNHPVSFRRGAEGGIPVESEAVDAYRQGA